MSLVRSPNLDELLKYEALPAFIDLERKLVCTNCLSKNFILSNSFSNRVAVIWRLDRTPNSQLDDCNYWYISDSDNFAAITQFFAVGNFDVKEYSSLRELYKDVSYIRDIQSTK